MADTVIFWLSGALAIASCFSAFILSLQRTWLHKSQQRSSLPLRFDDKRDPTSPSADDAVRQNRLTFGTLLLASMFALKLYEAIDGKQQQEDWSLIVSCCIQFISCLYTLVLALVSRRYRFPNEWGWILNVHLAVLYSMGWCNALYSLYKSFILTPSETWTLMLPDILIFLLYTDLVCVTMTASRGPPFVDENGKQVAAVNVASIFSLLYFQWATPIVQLAFNTKKLEDKDLPTLPPLFRGHNLYYIFGESRNKSLISRIYLANRRAIIIQITLAAIAASSYCLPAFIVNRLLTVIQSMNGKEDSESIRKGFLIVASLGVSVAVLGIVVAQLWYYASSSIQVRIKAMLNIEIYRKTLRRRDLAIELPKLDEVVVGDGSNNGGDDKSKEKDDSSSSTGTIVNLMSTDANRISEFATWWSAIVEVPIELTVAIYFLYNLLGKSCFLGLLVMVIVLPLNHYNAKMYARTQDKLMEARDKRVNLMNEVLQGIRQIKFFAWEKNWSERIMEAREVELHHLSITYISGVMFSFIWQSSTILVCLVSFYSFTKLEGQELTAPIAFTAINVFSELKFALNVLPEVIVDGLQALISVRRIEEYLNESEIEPPLEDASQNINTEIGFENATVRWSLTNLNTEQDDDANRSTTFVLKDLNFKFPESELSLISGATGSGKTLMMLSLLGEAVVLKGSALCPRQAVADTVSSDFALSNDLNSIDWLLPYSLAYVSQTAWLQNASIRDNILFGLPYVESRYRDTLTACALDKDLEIFEDGDMTEIGEKGITLSGGQKARVSLARAVYSRAKNVLMDDVLSAVDAHTAKHLYEKCLLGPLMENRTRVLITHHVKLCITGSAYIVHIDEGRATLHGTPDELRQSGELLKIIESEEEQIEDEGNEEGKPVEDTLPAHVEVQKDKKAPRVLVEEETRATGMVKIRLYQMYFAMVGSPMFWTILAAVIFGSRGLDIAESWWIKEWSHSYDAPHNQTNATAIPQQEALVPQFKLVNYNTPLQLVKVNTANTDQSKADDLNFYLGVYTLIVMSNIIFGSARFAILYWGALRANRTLYSELLHRVFRAPLRFFDTTPVGRILNRFSKDFETIDSEIPNNILHFVIQCIAIVSSIVTVGAVLPVFSIPMIIVTAIIIYLGSMFVSVSRELKRMDSVSRSPLFSHFTETIVGAATIRSFGATRMFLQNMLKYVDANSRPYFYVWLCNRWIHVRLALIGAIINVLTGVIILKNIETMNASVAGFCLSFVLAFTDQVFWEIRRYTSLEMSFNAIERVVDFMEMDQEAPTITQLRPPTEWPTRGEIEVNDLEVRYATDLPPVLKGISFSIKPQEKVGVVGRTGSGKSTLALSFFRFIEASKGSIVIDGLDIKDLGTEDLRSNLTIIPQDPTLFSGSLRTNMDPFNQFTDDDVFTALRRVQLLSNEVTNPPVEINTTHNEVNTNVFKDLQTAVTEGGKNFSQGQRQLLCLARALLKRSRIVLMDEATASVDFETDKAIQNTISTEFADSTILCIAHRLHTVIEYDRILVLDQGEIVEFDSPLTLINNSDTVFYKMCRNSGEFESLVALARSKHELVDIST